MPSVLEIIENIPALREIERDKAERIAELFSEQRFAPGEVIHSEGSRRERLLIIVSGMVEISRVAGARPGVPLITYVSGDTLSEGILLDDAEHSTTAVAKTPVVVWGASGDALRDVLDRDPGLKAHIYGRLIRRLAERLDRLAPRATPDSLQLISGNTRIERDLLGDKEVPANAYFGVQTARALENFQITGVPISLYPDFIAAIAMVKVAAAKANRDCEVISGEVCDGIVAAAAEVTQGKLMEQFAVDVIQGGAGTSTNMNANEVIANRALEIMGYHKGDYQHCHPNDHVNASQSTNDVYPTSLKLAMLTSNRRLVSELEQLVAALRAKGEEFADLLKMGRTHLQDAVPMTLGQEFDAFASTIENEIEGLEAGAGTLLEINMGGTAVGTGLNAPKGYSQKVVQYLVEESGFRFRLAPNLVEATQDTQGFVLYSATLKSLAVKMIKVCNDLRLLASGPRAGFAEIRLPEKQPGSSIMPGKVNPVIPEVVNQVCFKILGNDLAVSLAAQAGQLQLNVMEPVIAASVLESIRMMMNGSATLRVNCIDGIADNRENCQAYVDKSIGVVTALVPVLGYKPSTALAAEALRTGRGVVELVREKGLLTEEQIADILEPAKMARPAGRF
ncbi:MAG: aspartate ammonia-lyase [Sedimenticolaceae bacterium]